jgi:hypothetical protein
MARYYDGDMDEIQQLRDKNDRLGVQLRATTKEYNDRVEWLERLLALALYYANMTRKEVEEALEKEEQEALEESAGAMAWAGCESLMYKK